MKFPHVEKIDMPGRGHNGKTRSWLKRRAIRTMRRAAKQNPEEAPKRMVYRGWMS